MARLARWPRTAAFLVYAALAFVFFGLPVAAHPSSECICFPGSPDPQQFMWALVWWPHALAHGLDPIHSHALFAPEGVNLASGQLIPAASVALAPITAAAGPVAAYNVLGVLAPALAAFTAFLLCRRITRKWLPSLVGGYLFGFSSYLLGQLFGHAHLTLVFLLPVMVHLVLRRLDGELGTRRFVAAMAACVVGQALLSPEIAVMFSLFGAAALALGALVFDTRRRAIVGLVRPLAIAFAIGGVVLLPYLIPTLQAGNPVEQVVTRKFSTDLLNFLFPTPLTRIGRRWFADLGLTYQAELDESGAYLGLPLILILVRLAVADWRRSAVRYLVGLLVLLGIATLGARLQIAGHSTIPMPWAAFDQLPALEAALPARFAVYVALVAAVAASLWLAWSRESVAWRWVLGALAVAATLPNLAADYWHGPARIPRYFTDGAWRADLRSNDVALLLPFGFRGNGMAWQAQTRIGFKQAGGYMSAAIVPPGYRRELGRVSQPAANAPPDPARLRAFLANHRVKVVILDPTHDDGWLPVLARAGLTPHRRDGVLVYPVSAARR